MSDISDEHLIVAIRRLLVERGPSTVDELIEALSAGGIALPPDPQEALDDLLESDIGLVMTLADGRWVWLPALLDGRVFTHRLSALEVEHDAIAWGRDLAPLSMLTENPAFQQLSDGAPIAEVFAGMDDDEFAARGVPEALDAGEGVLLLPAGRLAAVGVGVGDLIGMRVGADGFELTAVAEVTPCDLAALLTTVLAESPERPMMLDLAVWTVCAVDDGVFRRPAAPLGEQVDDGGFACQREWVALPGSDYGTWDAAKRINVIAERYGLEEDEALAVLVMKRMCEHTLDMLTVVDSGEDADVVEELPSDSGLVRSALEFLADPVVAAAVLDEIPNWDRRDAAALGVFAESAEPQAPRAARPALLWMRARAHERLGDIEEAERVYQQADSLDPSWPLAPLALARYAEDRGDAEHALSLLRRAGMPDDHPRVAHLMRYRPAPRIGLGRNEKCWCGSGRKYKVCHLNREQAPLEERAGWLYQKATTDLMDGQFAPLLFDCARERSAHSTEPKALAKALYEDPLPLDVVLFEGGAFEEFLAQRGSLLPEDERLLAEQWLLVERSVHEVIAVRAGQGMTMRDVRTGDVNDVRELSASTMVGTGEFYCGRIVPVGDVMVIFGGLEPLSLVERDQLVTMLDEGPDPVDLVAALSRRFAPPTLVNTEGEPMLLCDATFRVSDPDAVCAGLDATYQRADDGADGGRVWLEHVVTHGMQRIRAHLDLRGDQLHVHANSHNRFERVLATVRALEPSAELLSQTREPVGTMADVERLASAAPAGVIEQPVGPEIRAALEEMTRTYEQAWLDEAIPALSGRTPRQCAADPTRRPDLIRLLDTFPETGQPGAMSPARLREALGLA